MSFPTPKKGLMTKERLTERMEARITKSQLNKVEILCKKHQLTPTQLFRKALTEYLENQLGRGEKKPLEQIKMFEE